jgi:glycosyltransferase involved in cell wall biosynthesis
LRKQVEIHPFTDYAAYLANLASCHAAVMPLTNDIFNRCKSAVRVLDAAAVGVPVIVPDVGDFSAVVRQGKTGFVLSQDQAQNGGWYTALDQLASDRPAAQAMGANAALDLRQNWTARNTPPIIEPEVIKWVRA